MGPLQIAAHQQVEGLVGAAQLDVGPKGHRVVGLRDRVQELVQADGPPAGIAAREIFTLEHLRHREVGGFPDHALECERREPRRVELDSRPGHLQDLAELGAVRLGVRPDLVPRKRPARLGASRGISDHAGEIADDDDDLVAEILEVSELLEHDRVPQVQIRGGRVETQLDLERCAGRPGALKFLYQLRLNDDLGRPSAEAGHLLVDGTHGTRGRGGRSVHQARGGTPLEFTPV